MNINAFCELLRKDFEAVIHSDISPAPGDIDICIPSNRVVEVIDISVLHGFVLTSQDPGQTVLRRFENGGELYILDLMSSFSVYTNYVATFELSRMGGTRLVESAALHKCFKYLCFQQVEKLNYINLHLREVAFFFSDRRNFDWISLRIKDTNCSSAEEIMRQIGSMDFSARWAQLYLRNKLISPIQRRAKKLCTGYSLAFIGPDGSGKSFVIDKLRQIGPTKSIYMGDWFFFFQKFYNLLLKIRSPWNRFIYLIYLVENFLRILRVNFFRMLGYIVLIDRFPGTNRNVVHKGGLKFLNTVIFKIFPKPDLLVFLHAPSSVVYARKQELSVAEIEAIQLELTSLIKDHSHLLLDTQELDASLNKLLFLVYKNKLNEISTS